MLPPRANLSRLFYILFLCFPPPQTFVLTVDRVGQLESQSATSHLVFLSSVRPPERPAPVSRGPSPASRLTGSFVSRSGRRESGCDADTVGHRSVSRFPRADCEKCSSPVRREKPYLIRGGISSSRLSSLSLSSSLAQRREVGQEF